MRKFSFYLLGLVLLSAILVSGCRREGEPYPYGKVDGIDVTIPRVVLNNGKITVFVSVTDLDGRAITNINSSHLQIQTIKDGVVKDIGNFNLNSTGGTPTPIAAALTMDYSGSMYYDTLDIPAMEAAVSSFIGLKAQTDLAEIIKFDDTVVVLQSFTADSTLLANAINDTVFTWGGATAFYRACLIGLVDADTAAAHNPNFLPAVIGFTDGLNNQAPTQPDTVITSALLKQIPVYTIGYGNAPDTATLKHIADTTGGRFYWSPSPSSVQQLYQYVNGQLTNAVVIAFPWGSKDNATIRVTVTYHEHVKSAEKLLFY